MTEDTTSQSRKEILEVFKLINEAKLKHVYLDDRELSELCLLFHCYEGLFCPQSVLRSLLRIKQSQYDCLSDFSFISLGQ